ncbi:sigma factor-like helix-turn-helix DNA-binding protein [Paenibacillus planticolens]|uniref:RNA polymerase subunit sigma n=1 Tax=Paenibacillus planticolens TaxID=2654976 RepID=A0ABX1ZEE6_9BACL|nr:sigma factor-like helix-turn-helix DNA-binding protein [Paenibacillus planticolens]NOU98466.1 RNA polymerase subunit sigma [Paenibacillus planticolens]
MGTGSIDIEAKSRKYTQSYALNTAKGVAALLRDRHRISERRFRGDTAASDIIIDLHSAIETAGLTERQAESVAWVYARDLTLESAGEIMGVTKQAVKDAVSIASEKIATVFQRWNYGEVTVEVNEQEAQDDEE